MLQFNDAFSGFSVNDLAAAKEFYGHTIGVTVEENPAGLTLNITNEKKIFVYPKSDHIPATYTILNFEVDDIDVAVDTLVNSGVAFEKYEGMTDEKGVARGISANRGPDIAWFKDPAGNILSVLHNA